MASFFYYGYDLVQIDIHIVVKRTLHFCNNCLIGKSNSYIRIPSGVWGKHIIILYCRYRLRISTMPKKVNRNITFYSILIFLIVSICFVWSVCIRSEWFGSISKENHQWLTASTIKFAQNWLAENPFKLYFLQLENPNSIEFTQLSDRGIYLSYPVGAILPVYLLSLLNSSEVSPKVVMAVNLINQYLIALTLAYTLFFLLLKTKIQKKFSFLLAIFSGITYIFLPGNLYWHQNTYYADQAVMLPFVLFICIEMILKYVNIRPPLAKFLRVIQILTAFYGGLCDYLFYCVGAILFLKRLIFKEFGDNKKAVIKNMFIYALPFILAISTLIFQVLFTNGINALYETFLQRTGISEAGAESAQNFIDTFWCGHIKKFYGISSCYILPAGIGILVIFCLLFIFKKDRLKDNRKNIQMLLEFSALILLPCLLQIYLLKNHSAVHSFSTLKLSLFLSTFPFIITPILFCLFKYNDKNLADKASFIFAIALVANTFYLTSIYPIHQNLFSPSDDYSAELFLKHSTSYEDIVFSTNYKIPENPPHQLAYSEKRVYQVDSIEQIEQAIEDLQVDYTINIFVDSRWNVDGSASDAILQPLIDRADDIIDQEPYTLYEISKENFLAYIDS